MIDLTGLPEPEDAPAKGACVRLERLPSGAARLTLDPPHRSSYAVFDVPLLRDLDAALDEVAAMQDLRALVICGKSPLSFAAGADVELIAALQDPELSVRFVREGQGLLQRLYKLSQRGGGRLRIVAAVGGPVPGGACELSLACDRIVLADDPSSRIGLPEVLLGIYPAWGGTQRLPRRLGVPAALGAILSGKLYRAQAAYRMGFVDRLAKPEYLLDVAERIALGSLPCKRRGQKSWRALLIDRNPLVGALIANRALKGVMKKTGGHYPAPLVALPLIVRAPRMPLEAGLEQEAAGVAELTASKVTRNLLFLFLESEKAKKQGRDEAGQAAAGFQRAAVVGAGIMGGAIAGLMAEKGLQVRLKDLQQEQLDAALREQQAVILGKLKRRRLQPHEADAAIDRLEASALPLGFGRCEMAIEAVAERLEVKRSVLAELAELLGDQAILASNTSSLSIDRIAEGLAHPERLVGMHFFNPVRRMPLVEVVRGKASSAEAVARVAQLAVRLGKIPVITADVAGFLVNRLLGPYLDEALRLVAIGCEPEAVDRTMLDFGMPMGPCELIDEVGLDIAAHTGTSLFEAFGERMRPSPFIAPLVAAGQLGKKSGAGLYTWKGERGGKQKKTGRNDAARPNAECTLSTEDMLDRMLLVMVNEAARALQEGVVSDAASLDLAVVMGTGFAPFRGGVLHYADERGLKQIVQRLEELSKNPRILASGERLERFEPAPLLLEYAHNGKSFYAG